MAPMIGKEEISRTFQRLIIAAKASQSRLLSERCSTLSLFTRGTYHRERQEVVDYPTRQNVVLHLPDSLYSGNRTMSAKTTCDV